MTKNATVPQFFILLWQGDGEEANAQRWRSSITGNRRRRRRSGIQRNNKLGRSHFPTKTKGKRQFSRNAQIL